MRRWLIGRVAVLAPVAIGVALAVPAWGITFGEPDGSAHPNVGALCTEVGGVVFQVCSGTLISETVFLTAGHCTSFLADKGLPALVTFDSEIGPGSIFVAGELRTHPAFKPSNGVVAGGGGRQSDLGVVVFERSVLGLCGCQPVELPTLGFLDGLADDKVLNEETFTAAGYGLVRDTKTGPPAAQLGPTNVRMAAVSSFSALTTEWLHLSQNPATGNGGTCAGDSGGPDFLGDSSTLVGVTSSGDSFCRSTNVVGRVDTPLAREFLGEFMPLP